MITNDETREYSVLTVSELEKMVGVSLLPGVPQQVRDAGMVLPKPVSSRGRKNKGQVQAPQQEEFSLREFSRNILDSIGRAIHK